MQGEKQNHKQTLGVLALLGLIYFKEKKYELKKPPTFLVLGTGYKVNSSVLHGTSLPVAYSALTQVSLNTQETRTAGFCAHKCPTKCLI